MIYARVLINENFIDFVRDSVNADFQPRNFQHVQVKGADISASYNLRITEGQPILGNWVEVLLCTVGKVLALSERLKGVKLWQIP